MKHNNLYKSLSILLFLIVCILFVTNKQKNFNHHDGEDKVLSDCQIIDCISDMDSNEIRYNTKGELHAGSCFSLLVDSILKSQPVDSLLSILWMMDTEDQDKCPNIWKKDSLNMKEYAIIQALFECADGIDGEQLDNQVFSLFERNINLGRTFIDCTEELNPEQRYKTQYSLYLSLYSGYCWKLMKTNGDLSPDDSLVSRDSFIDAFPFVEKIVIPQDSVSTWSGEEQSIFCAAQHFVFD